MSLHIGKKIKDRAEQLRFGPTELAEKINTSKQNIYSIFKRLSIDTDILSKISVALEYDFFALYSEDKKILELTSDNDLLCNERIRKVCRTCTNLEKDMKHLNEKCNLLNKLAESMEKEKK